MKVSVILPNYNHGRYLKRRIDSILAQTHADFELLILDDASPDDSREVATGYAGDGRVRFAFNEQNSGNPYFQWRKGLGLTTGDYVWIAESDDYAEPILLERLVALLDANPTVGLAVCDSFMMDADDRRLQRYFDNWHEDASLRHADLSFIDKEFVMDGRDYARRHMTPWNTIPNASAVLFRRAAFTAIGGPVTSMKLCGDWLSYCRMLMRFDIARVPDHLNHFRQHLVNVRSRTSASDFIAESILVRAWLADALGEAETRESRRRARDFYCHVLLAGERRAADRKVPIGRAAVLLRAAARLSPAIFGKVVRMLARERAGMMVRALMPAK